MEKTNTKFSWDHFLVKQIEDKHDIKAVAKRDGLGEEPTTDSTGSVLEDEIKQECDTYISDHTDKLRSYLSDVENNQTSLSGHLKQDQFEPIVNNLDSSFHTLANEKEIKLSDLKNSYDTYKEEQKQFQRYHQLSREPNYATTSKTIKALGLIAFLFIIEVILNGSMLSGALVGGPIEGIAVATSVAFLNVCASALVGYYIFKNLTHLEKTKKILNGFFASLYVIFLVYINSCLGAYRSESQKVFDSEYVVGATKLSPEQIKDIFSNIITPWSGDIDYIFVGVILTFVGLTFAFISVMDGFLYNDTYPGYGNVGKNVNDYKVKIKQIFHQYADDVSRLFEKHNKQLQSSLENIRNNELNYWDANTNLIQKEFTTYTQKVELAERQTWHIIREYRRENQRVRKTTKPSYFDIDFSLPEDVKDPKKVFPDLSYHFMTDEQREDKKVKFSENIDQKFKHAEKEIEALQEASVKKQKELHEKYNTN
ncbi:hypothetical protein OAQ82_03625 [Candidatus Pelagibacter sp.]|nr:hypothetical protein [Candidatus Pelagibacter sp.]